MARLSRRLVAEFIGTALLLAVIVGSGIMAERLSGGNVALALLANSIATGCGLAALIYAIAPVSGAHLNPALSLGLAVVGERGWCEMWTYVAAQLSGALTGAATANVMFAEPVWSAATKMRTGADQWLGELVATFGLLVVIALCSRGARAAAASMIGGYVTAAYWFTSSTAFANPAVTLARATTNTFTGIRPSDVPGFVIAQFAGGLVALLLTRWLVQPSKARGAVDQ